MYMLAGPEVQQKWPWENCKCTASSPTRCHSGKAWRPSLSGTGGILAVHLCKKLSQQAARVHAKLHTRLTQRQMGAWMACPSAYHKTASSNGMHLHLHVHNPLLCCFCLRARLAHPLLPQACPVLQHTFCPWGQSPECFTSHHSNLIMHHLTALHLGTQAQSYGHGCLFYAHCSLCVPFDTCLAQVHAHRTWLPL